MKLKTLTYAILSVFLLISCEQNVVKTINVDPPQFLQDPLITELTADQATLQWQTDVPSLSKIRYVAAEMADTIEISDKLFSQNHIMTIKNLIDEQNYHFRVIATGIDGQSTDTGLMPFTTPISTESCWILFENGNYSNALQKFISIYDETDESVLLGLAWSHLKMDSLHHSLQNFQSLYYLDANNPDALAGLSIANHLTNNRGEAINFGELFMETNVNGQPIIDDPFYIFDYDTSINNVDVSIILAQNYYKNYRLEEVQEVLDFLIPDNDLVPEDSTSWKIQITIFNSYESVLGAYVDSLDLWFDFL